MKRQRKIYKENLQATKYGHILNSESEESFTMILNIDGAVTKNKHVSLWPITFMINEIPLPNRRYSESIILDGPYPLTKLKYYSFGESILFDSLYTLYLGVFKKFWLSSVIIPTTTSRRFRTIKHIARFKANEFRSLMHHRSTVLLQAMLPKYRRRFALLLMVVNIASKDVIDNYDIILVKGLLHQYVKDWQKIFDLRHMSSNIHSLLHIHESIQYLGPFYICIVLLILKVSIGHDLVYMIHGMTHCGPQLISNLQYYRQAIIDVFKHDYPEKLFYFNESILSRRLVSK
ncbi:unnamed protein product [Rotaria sordida]|uniref:Uncharacterized protein n=1 Tax=Rotaria sordida TaxID=392033 RepID=A0A813ZG08_9BILA|nr:unnamed protein product [Rotaria sordida]